MAGTPDMPKAGGGALKKAIHVARARAGITSDVALSGRAGVHYDTLMNWYAEKTVPRPHELRKVAQALGTTLGELTAAYEGVDPEPPPLVEEVKEQTVALREVTLTLRDLVVELSLARVRQEETGLALQESLGEVVRVLSRDRMPDAGEHAKPDGSE